VTSPDLQAAREAALAAAEAAAVVLRRYFGALGETRITSKTSAVDLVSNADVEAEHVIRAILTSHLPQAGFIGEESKAEAGSNGDLNWVVDPLDGTSNFLSGVPLWSTSIALTDGELQPLVGVVTAPVLNKAWSAYKGGGAQVNTGPCTVRLEPPGGGLQNAMLATGFPYHVSGGVADTNLANFDHMQRRFHKIRRLGSAAIDLAFIAEGTFDGMWELMLQAWDSAAGILLVTEAGGCVSRIDGRPFRPGDPDLLAAATPELLTVLQRELLSVHSQAQG
jgi:myo-inositol-1(or 4)-monophosphatase